VGKIKLAAISGIAERKKEEKALKKKKQTRGRFSYLTVLLLLRIR